MMNKYDYIVINWKYNYQPILFYRLDLLML